MWFQRNATNGIKITQSRHQKEFMKRKQGYQLQWIVRIEIGELLENITKADIHKRNGEEVYPWYSVIFEPVNVFFKIMYKCTYFQLYHSENNSVLMIYTNMFKRPGLIKQIDKLEMKTSFTLFILNVGQRKVWRYQRPL